MSSKKSKKKNPNSSPVKSKKKPKKKNVIIGIIICVLVVATIAFFVVRAILTSSQKSEFVNYGWISTSASDASGDEVEMQVVYNTDYSNYQGSLTFKDDNTFSLWLSPGSVDDGTHTGTYSIESNDKIKAVFTSGEELEFDVKRNNGEVTSIIIPYTDYQVYFTKQ